MSTTTRRSLSRWSSALLVAFVLLTARPAVALSCCGSALALADRLLPGERASLQLALSGWATLGYGGSRFLPFGDAHSELEGRGGLGGALRLSPAWQASLAASLVGQQRRMGELDSAGWGVSDVSVGARWEPAGSDSALVLSAMLPTGRSTQEASTVLGADATGRGLWSARVSYVHEFAFDDAFVQLQGGVGGGLPRPGGALAPMLDADAQVLAGYTFDGAAGVSGGVRVLATRFGNATPTLTTTLVLAGALPLAYGWNATATVLVDPPVGVLQYGNPARVGATVGVRALLGG